MKKYKVIEYFKDLQDNRYAYNVGDTYPRNGHTPTAERIEELASGNNKRKRALIEEIPEINEELLENEEIEVDEDVNKEETEKPKKRRKNGE